MIYSDPDSLLSHIQLEFESRIKWDWNRISHKQAKSHNPSTKPEYNPGTMFEGKWGKVVRCDPQGNGVDLMVDTPVQE